MKKQGNTKQMLFEMMEKTNPDFKKPILKEEINVPETTPEAAPETTSPYFNQEDISDPKFPKSSLEYWNDSSDKTGQRIAEANFHAYYLEKIERLLKPVEQAINAMPAKFKEEATASAWGEKGGINELNTAIKNYQKHVNAIMNHYHILFR